MFTKLMVGCLVVSLVTINCGFGVVGNWSNWSHYWVLQYVENIEVNETEPQDNETEIPDNDTEEPEPPEEHDPPKKKRRSNPTPPVVVIEEVEEKPVIKKNYTKLDINYVLNNSILKEMSFVLFVIMWRENIWQELFMQKNTDQEV